MNQRRTTSTSTRVHATADRELTNAQEPKQAANGCTYNHFPSRFVSDTVVCILAAPVVGVHARRTRRTFMPNDDKLDADSEVGAKDIAAQARRFGRVNNILLRALDRYNQIIRDIGSPSADPAVQAALVNIINTAAGFAPAGGADGIVVKVVKDPGPISDPSVQRTLQTIGGIGTQLNQAANEKLAGSGGGPAGPP